MDVLLSLLFIIAFSYLGVNYSKSLNELISYSQNQKLAIFNRVNSTPFSLMSDLTFFFSLMKKKNIEQVSDLDQKELLYKSRQWLNYQLIAGVFFALFFFWLVMRNAT